MTHNSAKASAFAALHRPGHPLVLFNAWDPGSAKVIAGTGAEAIATGSWSVAAANGFDDAEALPINLAIDNAARVVAAVDLPVSIDFEGGYAIDPTQLGEHFAWLAKTGAVGCNFEDRIIGGEGLHRIADQAARIRAGRAAVGPDFFINARTDIFLEGSAGTHDDAMVEAALERAHAYAEAGASGFFVPGLIDLRLLERVCSRSPLPVNFMAFPGAPDASAVAATGIARISHGPGPYRIAMAALKAAAEAVYSGDPGG